MRKPNRIDAIIALVGPEVTGYGDGSEFHYHPGQTPPSESAIDAKLVELEAEYDALQYQRDRKAEYPTIAELTVALYDTDDKADIEAKRAEVKAKYPKPV